MLNRTMQVVESTDDRTPAYSWYALSVLFLVYIVNFVDRQILSILANDIKADLGIDDAQLGFLYGTAFAIFYALFGIPLGRLADGWNRTRLLALGLTIWSLMTALSGFARNFSLLAIARVGVGVGEATASPCAYSLISDWFPPRSRATAIGIYSAGLFVGSGLSLLLGGLIVETWNQAFPEGGPLGLAGWQAAFLLVALPGLVLAAWVYSLREPERGANEGLRARVPGNVWRNFVEQLMLIVPPFTFFGAARRSRRALTMNIVAAFVLAGGALCLTEIIGNPAQAWFVAIGSYAVFSWAYALRIDDEPTFHLTFGTRSFMGIVVAYAIVSYTGYTVSYWAAPFAERTFGLTKIELGWLIGAPAALGGFLGVISGGWLADRFHQMHRSGRLWVTSVGLILPVPLVIIGYRAESADTFLVCSFLLQLTTSSALGASAAASQALVLPHMRGTATAIFFLGSTLIGLAFGPFTAGLVSEISGSLGTGVITNLAAVPIGLAALIFAIINYPADEASRISRAAMADSEISPAR